MRPTVLEIDKKKFLKNIEKIKKYIGNKEIINCGSLGISIFFTIILYGLISFEFGFNIIDMCVYC